MKERKDLANDDASLWILKSEKWVLPQLQGKGNQRLCQLRLHAVICMVVCAAENSPEHRGLCSSTAQSPVWGQGVGKLACRGLAARQSCLNVLADNRHSLHICVVKL